MTMKRIAFAVLTVLMAEALNAQLLWRITGKELKKPSYLLGTMHYAPACFIDSIQGLRAVMAEVEQVYCETVDTDTTANYYTPDNSLLVMPGDSVLADLYTEKEQKRIDHFLYRIAQFGDEEYLELYKESSPGDALRDLTIEHLHLSNAGIVFDSIPEIGFDTNFELDAIKNGKPVGALDDAALHRSVIIDTNYQGQLPLKIQAKVLLAFIDNYAMVNCYEYEMMLRYRSQDIALINNRNKAKANNKEYHKKKEKSCQGRNITWAGKMPAIMNDKSTLFVVGCAHLGHPKEKRGLLMLLQKAGYTLEPVNPSPKD